MIDLPHVASRVFGTPLMIARAKLEVVLGVLAPRFAGGVPEPGIPPTEPRPQISITGEGIAVVPVTGTLVARSGYLAAASGLLSYTDIGDAIEGAMNDPAVRGVVLDIDSGGGEVGGLFDLVDRIRSMRAASDKPLWAVANESALSAAYAIASAAERVYVTRTAEAGSIGVVAVHVDESGADAKAGLAWSFVFAGERKADANAHAPLSGEARAAIQADVDRLYGELGALVAANRRMTVESVRGTQAAIYRGALAVRAGLADRLGTLDTAIAEMASDPRINFGEGRAASPLPATINLVAKRSHSMATKTKEPEQIPTEASGPEPPLTPQMKPVAAPSSVAAASPAQGAAAAPRGSPRAGARSRREATRGIRRDRHRRRAGGKARCHGRCCRCHA